MKYTPELKGKTFERWTIIGKAKGEETLYNKFRVKCQCSCGTKRDVLWKSLVTGESKSCGCLDKEEQISQALPGTRFGKWEVIGLPIFRDNSTFYLCECECGTKREVNRYSLISEKSTSCGCSQSKGEDVIKQYLLDKSITFEVQYAFNNCRSPKGRKLKFDFAVFDDDGDLKLIIEFQNQLTAEQSLIFQPYDSIKKEYLLNNKIPHLYISFKEIKRIDEILDSSLMKR